MSGLIASHGLGDADGQLGEVKIVAAVERQVGDGLCLDHLADRGAAAFEQGRGGSDLDGFGDAADFQPEIDAGDLLDFEFVVSTEKTEKVSCKL